MNVGDTSVVGQAGRRRPGQNRDRRNEVRDNPGPSLFGTGKQSRSTRLDLEDEKKLEVERGTQSKSELTLFVPPTHLGYRRSFE